MLCSVVIGVIDWCVEGMGGALQRSNSGRDRRAGASRNEVGVEGRGAKELVAPERTKGSCKGRASSSCHVSFLLFFFASFDSGSFSLFFRVAQARSESANKSVRSEEKSSQSGDALSSSAYEDVAWYPRDRLKIVHWKLEGRVCNEFAPVCLTSVLTDRRLLVDSYPPTYCWKKWTPY